MPRQDELKPKGRILVDELYSVGLVEAGANGPADIMITKARGPRKLLEKLRTLVKGKAKVEAGPDSDAIEYALEFAAGSDELEKARNVVEWMESQIHSDFTGRADYQFGEGYLTREERIALSSAIGVALQAFTAEIEESQPQLMTRDPWADPAAISLDAAPAATGNTIVINNPPIAESTHPPTIEPVSKKSSKSPEKEAAEMPDKIVLSDETRADLDDTVKAYVEQLEADAAEVAKLAEATPPPEPEEDVLKDLPEHVQVMLKAQADQITKAEERAEAAETVAKAERDNRIAKEYLAKAEGLGHIAKADELGPLLMKVETGVALSKEDAEKLFTMIEKANTLIDTAEFYREFGKGGEPTSGSALAIIKSKAAELRKTDADLSEEQAEARVMKAEPELKRRADAEERERSEKAGR